MNKKPEEMIWLLNILKARKTIIGMVICVILAYLVTSPIFMKPLYESETLVYVPLTILNQQLSQQGIGFANEHEVDQYIQILRSSTVLDSLINRFGLRGTRIKSQVYKELESRIKIEKTRYSSVSIKVRDNDPQKAADMANQMVYLGEIVKQYLFYPNRQEAMRYSKSLFEQKDSEVALLENKLDSIEKKNLAAPLKYNWLHTKLTNSYKLELQELISRKNQYERALKDFVSPLPKAYLISSAVAAEKPIWPKPWLICFLAGIGYLFINFFIEIIKRDFKQKSL